MAMKDAISPSNHYSKRKDAKAVLNLYRMTLYARKIVLDKSNDDTAKKRRLRPRRKGEAKGRAGGTESRSARGTTRGASPTSPALIP